MDLSPTDDSSEAQSTKTATKTGSNEESESAETTSIVVLQSGDKPVQTARVSASWWELTERAEKVQNIVRQRYGDLPGFEGTGISSGKETMDDGHHYPVVEVEGAASQISNLAEEIPNRIRGIKIIIKLYSPAHAA